ncbi:hypothetical protein EDD11_003585 [Mortierella claussenii]|nr:hypothetical protein EDD11_003585 [Mortierella claussenii]
MSTFEAYLRTVLSDFYFEEMRATDPKNITVQALYSCRRILRRLYILDHEGTSRATARCKVRADDRVDTTEAEPSSTFIALPSPFITTTENIHVIARVIADQVCRGICLPETAVLILQTFSSLRDQSLLRYMMTNPPQDRTLQFSMQNRVSIGALCYQYLIPVGRHFNSLPTSTFIETFLDRSRGDLPIDRATVMVYGFMCVLDLETGKANLCSDSFKIFERSMPTRGVVQAKEIVRVMDRHSAFMRQLLHTAPACPSVHFSKDTSSVTFT